MYDDMCKDRSSMNQGFELDVSKIGQEQCETLTAMIRHVQLRFETLCKEHVEYE